MMKQHYSVGVLAVVLAVCTSAPALANLKEQQTTPKSYVPPNIAIGGGQKPKMESIFGKYETRLTGTVSAVRGNQVTVQYAGNPIYFDAKATPAKHRKRVAIAVGHPIVLDGYWQLGTFYATAIE